MACLWMWVYYLSMEGRVSNWVENTVGDYISTAGYHIILGEQQAGGEVCFIDSLFLQSRAESGNEQFPDACASIPKNTLGCLFASEFTHCRP